MLTAYGAIPKAFAYVAGLGDISIALSSIFVAKAIANKKPYAKPLLIVWNVLDILDIVSVLVGAIITTKISLATGGLGVGEISKFPFCLIPAFAAGTILFLHVGVVRRLRMGGVIQ
jgi:hypothetical protein